MVAREGSRDAASGAPSALNGERAGVRGGNAVALSWAMLRRETDHPSPSFPLPVEGRGRPAADARRFSDVLPHYRANPEFFKESWRAEVVQRVLTKADKRIYMAGKTDGKKQTLWLPLSRTPLKQKPAPEPVKGDQH